VAPTLLDTEIDKIIQSLSGEFLDDSGDVLQNLLVLLERVEKGVSSATEALLALRRETHSLKGLGGSFGFPSITLIAHRLEDYVVDLEELDTHHLNDTRTFIEAMQDVVESRTNPTDEACSKILRQLPAKGSTDKNFLVQVDLEVLLITSSQILRSAVEAQLHSRGYRVITLRSPLTAFETVIRSRPDMIIASAVMDGIGGVDLGRAFYTMSATRDIPFVLLTSFERTHPELNDLPSGIHLLRHDLDLYDEMDHALGAFSKSEN
jgi:CheY-like chemotaxis protein